MAMSVRAGVLTPNQALDRVMGDVGLMSTGKQKSRPHLVSTRSIDNQPAVYVYSLNDDNGYIVLSADDEAVPMLGYSDSGEFDAASINPTMQWWLDEYAAQIKWLRDNHNSDRYLTTTATTTAKQNIEPMVKTKWNQGAPFNNMCPVDDGKHCVTGCVATAMAQIVNYHKLPADNGIGIASLDYNGITYSFDFANESFDWDNMLDSYNGSYTDVQADAVAKLMYACGISAQISYGLGESNGSDVNVATALINNFGFDKGIRMYFREFYTLSEWNDLVYNQLKDYGPVQYGGHNSNAGHAFVCDGYNVGDFFHINWGWGGSSDGYFKLTALDPATQGIGGSLGGFNIGQEMVGNICAPRADSQPSYSMYVQNTLGVSDDELDLGTYGYISGTFINSSFATLNGSLGYRLEPVSGGNDIYRTSNYDVSISHNSGYYNIPFHLPASLAEGSYRLVPLWKLSTDSQWRTFDISVGKPKYINVLVEGSKASFTVPTTVKLQAEVKSFDSPFFVDKTFALTVKLTNNFDTEYLGTVFAAILTADGSTQVGYAEGFMTDVMPGETTEISYSSKFVVLDGQTITEGDYLIVLADAYGRIISSGYTINMQAAPTDQGSISVSSLAVKDADGVNAFDLEFTADVTCTDGYYIGLLYAYIFSTNRVALARISTPTLYIPDKTTQHVTFVGCVRNLEVGSQYLTAVYDENLRQLTGPVTFAVGSTQGIESISADNDVVARDVYDMSGRIVTGKQLKAGVYIVRERYADGTYRTEKMLVK